MYSIIKLIIPMRPKILAIQFRSNEKSRKQEQVSLAREAGIHAEVVFINALDTMHNWLTPARLMSDYQGLILGGSGDFDFDGNRPKDDAARLMSYELLDKLSPLFAYVFEHDIPTLGICYGHQLLGAFAGAEVRYDADQKKTGSHEVKLMVDKNDYFLFSDLPDSFRAHYGHKDSLDRVPEGAVLLLNGGEKCRVSALRYKNNIYTTQFHPELNFDDMVERVKNSPGYLPEGAVVSEVFSADPDSNKILRNFSLFVVEHSTKECVQNEVNIFDNEGVLSV